MKYTFVCSFNNVNLILQDGGENNDSGAESTSSPSESQDGPADVEENGTCETLNTDSDTPKINPARWTVCVIPLLSSLYRRESIYLWSNGLIQ